MSINVLHEEMAETVLVIGGDILLERNCNGYMDQDFIYIDKTKSIRLALQVYPMVYIEGAAAIGKTTAVNMFLNSIQQIHNTVVFDMALECENLVAFEEKINCLKKEIRDTESVNVANGPEQADENGLWYVVFENLHELSDTYILSVLAGALNYFSSGVQAIKCLCVSRDKPDKELLPFIWNRKMELIGMADFMLTKHEVGKLLDYAKSGLNLNEVYAITAGWAGCVDMMLRLSLKQSVNVWQEGNVRLTAADLRNSYEIDTYIKEYILKTLSFEEKQLMQYSQICPWLNTKICREIWGISGSEQLLDGLTRKGFLMYNQSKKCWQTAPLFQKSGSADSRFWKQLGDWYEQHQYIKEALYCFGKNKMSKVYKECMIKHYELIPYSDINYEAVLDWKEHLAECIYLRAMFFYEHQNIKAFEQEYKRYISFFEEKKEAGIYTKKEMEIYLNLEYVNPTNQMADFIEKLSYYGEKSNERIRLYHMLGYSVSALCGIRDLSELFACSKKEENKNQRIWRAYMDEAANNMYSLAKIEYYLETERLDAISLKEQDWILNIRRVDVLNLLFKADALVPEMEFEKYTKDLIDELLYQDKRQVREQVRAMQILYLQKGGSAESLIRWVRRTESVYPEINEDTYIYWNYMVKGYMKLRQYEKAKKILLLLIPYLKQYKRGYFLAEHLYQLAIIRWEENRHGQALQMMIESFLISRQNRYVQLYAAYGKMGLEVTQEYIKWMQMNAPEGWHRKKKYQYGNVLRMPEADYMEVVFRYMKQKSRRTEAYVEDIRGEHLTMMEMLVLQDINRGLTNAQICEELNVKLPTVKTHIYSIYKKLGVSSRVQAIIKGKERGLL